MEDAPDNRLREAAATFKMDGAYGGASPLRGQVAKVHRAKVFKSGNSLALRLPKSLGLEAGMEMELEAAAGGGYSLKPAEPPRRKLDVASFWGKAKGLHVPGRRDFDERPSTIAARLAKGGA